MIETLKEIFGEGKELNSWQMSARAVVISFICLVLIRLSGRRSFAMGTPLDNVLAILLGAILSRAVVGASSFLATVAAAATIVVLHRSMSWIGLYSHSFGKIAKGDAKIVYENGGFNKKNMHYCRITEKDLMAGVRLAANLEDLDKIEKVYVERNGRISVIKKDKAI